MNLEANDLLNQLTSRRQPEEDELVEAMSRAILRVLRHGDSSATIAHDCFGLFRTNELVAVFQARLEPLAQNGFQERFQRILESLIVSEKIEIRGDKIRALYGHSLRGIIVGEMKWPATLLFHATRERHLDSIFQHGLRPQGRSWVHLTSITRYADTILYNHAYDGPSVLLSINPQLLENHDVTFRNPNSHVWLATHIPPVAIEVGETNGHMQFSK